MSGEDGGGADRCFKRGFKPQEKDMCSTEFLLTTAATDASSSSSFKKDFMSLFSERGREGEREGEKHQCVVAS